MYGRGLYPCLDQSNTENSGIRVHFQGGGHEQSWLFGPLRLTWKLPWQCFVCSNLRGLGGTAVVMEVVFFFSFYHLYIFFALQLDNIFQESRNQLVLLLYNQQ